VPDQGRVELDMGSLLHRPEILEPLEILKGDLTIILTLRAAARGGGPG
jgi:hypothetical protein